MEWFRNRVDAKIVIETAPAAKRCRACSLAAMRARWIAVMGNSVESAIQALWSFTPSEDDTDNVHRLYQLFEGFRTLPRRERALAAMFALLERFPEADLGSPGPLVHELEAIAGYQPLLRDSLRRQPSYLTVWMVHRILNSRLETSERESWLSELRSASNHPLASERLRREAEEFLQYQASKI